MTASALRFPWRAFLRRRFPAHAEGWVYVQAVALFALYLVLAVQPVDVAYGLASFVAAVVVVGVLAGLAAVLRFPWWLLLPFCLVSMALEALWRALVHRPWQRAPVVRRWYLSNAVALWQSWDLQARRRRRRAARSKPEAPAPAPATHRGNPAAKVLQFPTPPGLSIFDYALDALESHIVFWYVVGFLGCWLALVWGEGMGWLAGLGASFVLFIVGTVFLVLPVVFGFAGFLSALLAGASLSPLEREQHRRHRLANRASSPVCPSEPSQGMYPLAPPSAASAATRPKRVSDWLLPFALGLWIGSAWGRDA